MLCSVLASIAVVIPQAAFVREVPGTLYYILQAHEINEGTLF